MIEISFGEKLDGIEYHDRIGAYGIGFDKSGKIPVVKTSTGYFLLGGGIENAETHQECVIRECLEEVGLQVIVKEFICKGDKYHWSDTLKYYLHGIGHFYLMEIGSRATNSCEQDHHLVWLSPNECIAKLFLEHQSWAVQKALELAGI